MTGKIIYYICDACKKNTLKDPDIHIIVVDPNYHGESKIDRHMCTDCVDSDWFYCSRCKAMHQFECPELAAKIDAEMKQWESDNAEQLARVKAHNDAIPF